MHVPAGRHAATSFTSRAVRSQQHRQQPRKTYTDLYIGMHRCNTPNSYDRAFAAGCGHAQIAQLWD